MVRNLASLRNKCKHGPGHLKIGRLWARIGVKMSPWTGLAGGKGGKDTIDFGEGIQQQKAGYRQRDKLHH